MIFGQIPFLTFDNFISVPNFSFPNMLPWWPGLTISLSRVRLFWPDLSFGLMTTGRVTNRRPFTEILRTQGKPDLVRKQTFHLNQLFGKFRLKGKAERCTRRSAGKMTGLMFYFHQFRQTIIRHQSNPGRKKIIRGGVRLPRVMTKKRDQGQNKGPVTK